MEGNVDAEGDGNLVCASTDEASEGGSGVADDNGNGTDSEGIIEEWGTNANCVSDDKTGTNGDAKGVNKDNGDSKDIIPIVIGDGNATVEDDGDNDGDEETDTKLIVEDVGVATSISDAVAEAESKTGWEMDTGTLAIIFVTAGPVAVADVLTNATREGLVVIVSCSSNSGAHNIIQRIRSLACSFDGKSESMCRKI